MKTKHKKKISCVRVAETCKIRSNSNLIVIGCDNLVHAPRRIGRILSSYKILREMKKRKCNNCNEEMRESNYKRHRERCLKGKRFYRRKNG